MQDVVDVIERNNVDIPSGRVEGEQREFLIQTQGQFEDAEPFNRLTLTYRNGAPVRLADVGQAVDGVEEDRQVARCSGEVTTGLGIVKQSDANTVVLSVVFIYLVLSAQFESFIYPLTILVSLPLATVGAFGGLWLFGLSLNINAFIGVIMLMGLVTKNAILRVDYTNVLINRGMAAVPAAQEAAKVRFRPVLMTAVSTVLGMMRIALGFGAGGEARMPLGVTVAAGLAASRFLTLLVIPVVYMLVGEAQSWLLGLFRREREDEFGAVPPVAETPA